MAFVLTSTCPTVNVDYPVGGSASNRPDDVMLVQGLLLTWAWYQELSASGAQKDFNPVRHFDLNALKVDGHFGPQTRAMLRLFVNARRAVGQSAEGWVMPMHIENFRSGGKPFKVAMGSYDLITLATDVMFVIEGSKGYVDTARGKYQRYGLFCLGWDMPSRLAASLAQHRSKPHYVEPLLIDI